MKKILSFMLMLLLALSLNSCQKDHPEPYEPTPLEVQFSEQSISFPVKPTSSTEVTVVTDYEWFYEIKYNYWTVDYPKHEQEEWLSVEKNGNKLVITAKEHKYKPRIREAQVIVKTFGETEHSNHIYVTQTAYYFTGEGVNELLSPLEKLSLRDYKITEGIANGSLIYSGDDHPFELEVELKYEQQSFVWSNALTYGSRYAITGDNKTNIKLSGAIYLTPYYYSGGASRISHPAGTIEIEVNGSNFSKTFSYIPN